MNTTALKISDELARVIEEEAQNRGVSIESFLEAALRRERTLAARRKIEREQAWWLALPLSERAKYEGEFVAVHNQRIVDHDSNEIALFERIRKKYGDSPVLIIPAEGPRELHIFSPRLQSS
ncbi:MAG: hypothetical protein GXP42_04685 [Chloroflexi bacterium]|nr:hypothetical protein [Chloroflexota bacterium]